MRTGRRRRGAFWYTLPPKVRLMISIGVLAILLVGVVLIARGCARAPEDKATSAPPTSNTTASPDRATTEDAPDRAAPPGVPEEQGAVPPANPPVQNASFGSRSAVIRSIGDIVAHKPILKSVYDAGSKDYDFAPVFENIASSMGDADYTVLNVDGPLGGKKFAAYRGYPQFNTPPHLLNALSANGVDMLTLANNHALDTYFDGLIGTIDNVEKVGLAHLGAYRTQEEHDAPTVVNIGGIGVGFLNYTVSTNGMAKKSDAAATQYGLRMVSNSDAPADISAARSAGAEIVVVYMHWGEEYQREVSPDLKKMAGKLVAAGADVVIGGHQHVVLPCEWVNATGSDGQARTGLVLYGMGNFLSDQRERYKDSGIIFEFTLQDNPSSGKVEVLNPRYVPTYVDRVEEGKAYQYRVYPCGAALDNRPADLSNAAFQRMQQVVQELSQVFSGTPAQPAKR
ncbi:MAG: CapA family protein [Clostridia bacterium]